MYVAGNGRGGRFPTKAALKLHVKEGKSIDLIPSGLTPDAYTSESMPEGKVFTIVGPGEYDRKWYANAVKRNGVVKIS